MVLGRRQQAGTLCIKSQKLNPKLSCWFLLRPLETQQSQAWDPSSREDRQEKSEFEANLGFMVRTYPKTMATQKICRERQQEQARLW